MVSCPPSNGVVFLILSLYQQAKYDRSSIKHPVWFSSGANFHLSSFERVDGSSCWVCEFPELATLKDSMNYTSWHWGYPYIVQSCVLAYSMIGYYSAGIVGVSGNVYCPYLYLRYFYHLIHCLVLDTKFTWVDLQTIEHWLCSCMMISCLEHLRTACRFGCWYKILLRNTFALAFSSPTSFVV